MDGGGGQVLNTRGCPLPGGLRPDTLKLKRITALVRICHVVGCLLPILEGSEGWPRCSSWFAFRLTALSGRQRSEARWTAEAGWLVRDGRCALPRE
ncbi:hypothetical protein E2C01_030432 [Portunus trituberculatus]|uniref:Uncharacterized protein n=1 Tax=Portunus trituberculatus TaxID=210409 RepID=A0A5B7EQF1_PORTR|nr:hypothetical protein [Portunus trituberculatus]